MYARASSPPVTAETAAATVVTAAEYETMKVFVGTWNMGNAIAPENKRLMNTFLPGSGTGYDIVAVGVQECQALVHPPPSIRS